MAALIDALGGGTQTRFVGGAIRDTLLGLRVSDVDLATRLEPGEVIERLRAARIKAVPTGIAHGTVTAVSAGTPVEITTLRRDVSTDGRHATVAFTDDWMEDAARRDFTINALYADPQSGAVQDYFGGLADLDRRLVRFIGDPLTRIAEDHLRILRFFRFHARFGRDEPDSAGLDACTARANDLMALSRERIADELLKLLALPDPAPTVRLMVERGILRPVVPEIDRGKVAELERLVAREAAAEVSPEALRRLAALLPPDPELAASIAARLRLSNRAAKRLVTAAERREGDADRPLELAYRVGSDEAVDRLLLGGGDPALVGTVRDWTKPRFPLGGGELIAMGLEPGPLVARTMQAIERAWIEGGFVGDRETVSALARAHVERALSGSQ
jgi:poly(A) polymerase